MNFELRAMPFPLENEKAFWFVFWGDKLLIELKDQAANFPFTENPAIFTSILIESQYLGRLDSFPCYTGELPKEYQITPPFSFIDLRQLFGLVKDELFWLAARAYHLMNWNRKNQYCSRCGEKVVHHAIEHSKVCPKCHLSIYPKISPAVIVAVTKDDKILLAKNAQSTTGFYSVLAGFVEPGETLEECVQREIKEEAGIEVKNIRYFGSQPWPFPDSLMIGYTAEYASGELMIDKNELADAAWFSADELPNIPGHLSISRKLIDWFVSKYGKL